MLSCRSVALRLLLTYVLLRPESYRSTVPHPNFLRPESYRSAASMCFSGLQFQLDMTVGYTDVQHFTLLHTAQKIRFFLGALRSYLPCILYPKAYFRFAPGDFPVHGQVFSDWKGALYCRFERLPSRDSQTESVPPLALHRY